VFIMLEGEALFTVDGREIAAGPDDVLIVPPDTPHGFTNSGESHLRQVNIHVSPSFTTDWL
jgi:mannose-6-phosphate isomerase-like protein (cupin superfamily)